MVQMQMDEFKQEANSPMEYGRSTCRTAIRRGFKDAVVLGYSDHQYAEFLAGYDEEQGNLMSQSYCDPRSVGFKAKDNWPSEGRAFKPSFPNPDKWTDALIRVRISEFAAFQASDEGIAEVKAFADAYTAQQGCATGQIADADALERGRKMLRYTKIDENERGWLIEFEMPITEINFKEVCQSAIEIAKIECATQKTVAINFVAMGIDVQVAETDTVETQFALWKPRADAYKAIRNDLAKSWDPQYLDNKGLPLPEVRRQSRMRP